MAARRLRGVARALALVVAVEVLVLLFLAALCDFRGAPHGEGRPTVCDRGEWVYVVSPGTGRSWWESSTGQRRYTS